MVSVYLRPFLITLATAVILAGPALRVNAADAWLRIESANFDVIGNAAELDIRSAATRLERFRVTANKLFGLPNGTEPVKIRVVVFKDAASFSPFKPKLATGEHDELAAGYFQAGDDVSYIAVTAGENGLATIYHEYSHFLLNRHFGNAEIPPWLNEGLAEYMETFRPLDGDRVEIGAPHVSDLALLRSRQLIPWKQFLKFDSFTLQQSGSQVRTTFYAQAWATVFFLIQREPGDDAIPKLLRSVAQATQNNAPSRVAGIDLSTLDAGVRSLITSNAEDLAAVSITSDPGAVATIAGALSEPMWNAYLGDLLYHLRDTSAESYLARALAAERSLGMANATLGLVRLRQRRFDDAKRLLEKAIASDDNSYLVHYYYAYLLSREYMDEFGAITQIPASVAAKMDSSLKRSVRLNPRFAESHKLAALLGLITGDGLDNALFAANRARELQPGNDEYAMLAARVYARLERMPEAKATAEKILRTTGDAYLRREALEIARAADEYTAAKTPTKAVLINLGATAFREPLILKWKDLTAEQVAKFDDEREVNNLNVLLDRVLPGEQQAVGNIDLITCSDGRIYYRVKADGNTLRLTTRSFQDLKVKILTEGTRSFAFRCGSRFTAEKAVVRFRPTQISRADNDGVLIGVTFVPPNFRPKPLEEIANEPLVIIEGRPSTDLAANSRAFAAEKAEMERVLREQQLRDIDERLRPPLEGEIRVIAVPENVACTEGKLIISARSAKGRLIFESPITRNPAVNSFTPETGLFELGCRSGLPPVSAVFTYREAGTKDGRLDLVAVEFVPGSFRLQ